MSGDRRFAAASAKRWAGAELNPSNEQTFAKIDEDLLFEIGQANPGKFELAADAASGGFTLPDDGMWSPDTTYISAATYDNASDDDLARSDWKLVPSAVFELMFEGDRVGSKKYYFKMQAYHDNALALVVVIDPKERRTFMSRDGQPFVESFDLELDLGSHMPGFVRDAGAVFAAEDRRRKRARRA